MIPVDYDDHRHLFVQVMDSIKAAIATGEIPLGSMLPERGHLADRLGVSVPTVTKATSRLKDEGVIAGRKGMGLYVRTKPTLPEGYRSKHRDLMTEIDELRARIERLESR